MSRRLLSAVVVITAMLWLCTPKAQRLVKRADDHDPLEAVVSQLSQKVASLEAQVAALRSSKVDAATFSSLQTDVRSLQTVAAEKKVAFLATLNEDVAANTQAPFHQAEFNFGNAFDPTSGIFTAPYSGVYLFTVQVFPEFIGDIIVDLYRNGMITARMRVYDSTLPTSESTAMVSHAAAGDKYWVQVTLGGKFFPGYHSIFSGAILFPDD